MSFKWGIEISRIDGAFNSLFSSQAVRDLVHTHCSVRTVAIGRLFFKVGIYLTNVHPALLIHAYTTITTCSP